MQVIYFTAAQVEIYSSGAGILALEGRFRYAELGLFRAFLERNRLASYVLLIDTLDEGFQQDNIPFLKGRDRQAVVSRKLLQHFGGVPLSLSLSLGREAEGRRDERMLFVGFSNYEQYAPWINAIDLAEVKLLGVYSAGLIGLQLLDRTGYRGRQCLLVSAHSAGLRLSFYDGGQLRFSRLAKLESVSDPIKLAGSIAVETDNTGRYLASQRMRPTDAGALDVLVLVRPEHRAMVEAACPDSREVHFQMLDLIKVCEQIGLKSHLLDAASETVFMHLLAQKQPKDQFAAPGMRRFYKYSQWRKGLWFGGIAVSLGCLLFAASNMYLVWQRRDANSIVERETRDVVRRYSEVTAGFPNLPIATEALTQVVARYRTLAPLEDYVPDLLADLAGVIEASPEMQLDELRWSVDTNRTPSATGGVPPTPAAASLPSGAQGGASAATRASITLTGSLIGFDRNDARAMHQALDNILARFRANARLAVSTVRLPVNVDSSGSLAVGRSTGQTSDAQFVFKIERRL